jgi:hypothetical protein
MATTIQPSAVKAVDPGLGFTLTLSNDGNPINKTVKVVVTITGPRGSEYKSTISIDSAVSDTSIQIVAPFGDANYVPGTMLQYTIDVYVPGNSNKSDASFSGAVFAASGNFQVTSGLPKMASQLTNNQMINSVDDNYIGIMQSDGNFCVYEKSTVNAQQVKCTDSTNSAGSIANYRIMAAGYNTSTMIVQIVNTDNGQIVATGQKPIGGLLFQGPISLIVDAKGQICVGVDVTNPNAYQPIQFIRI